MTGLPRLLAALALLLLPLVPALPPAAQAPAVPPPAAQPPAAPARGELLYTTHCVACHTREVHWRARRVARDWSSLTAETQRWQRNLGLGWSDDDVDEVARYLNTTIYRFPEQAGKQLS